jgi:4-alpha-glucanotransferase
MKHRGSGVLLHITSLPSPFGIGDLGPWAYRFADHLSRARQKYWQVLPLNPTDPGSGNSPYSSSSAFAGNTLLISPELLLESGFISKEGMIAPPLFPRERCDFISGIPFKHQLFQRAYERFGANRREREAFDEFSLRNRPWLEDYALFVVIKRLHNGRAWGDWDRGLRDRDPHRLEDVKRDYPDALEQEKFLQFLFFRQWLSLKKYCNEKGLKLIGDIPIYVNYDSADAWTHADLFKLDGEKRPSSVAGVPPDYFSQTGQLWGNPIYRWDTLQQTGYRWWFERIGHNLQLFDILRIDHFRGFVAYWEVAATEETAIRGRWVEAPAHDFFTTLLQRFPAEALIAEDLGMITQDVKDVMNRFGFPGMRILQFAFDGDLATHPFLPHNYVPNCVVYTGTHDNNTATGWFKNEATSETKQRLFRYLGRDVSDGELPKELIRILMMSIANTVIIPMQDLLGLGEEARMNRPSTAHGNWEWRFFPDQFTSSHQEMLLELTTIYGRGL